MRDIRNTSRRKTSVSVNPELLQRAGVLLHTRTVKETIERALLEVLHSRAPAAEVAALSTMEGLDLDRPTIMKGAWRR
jgi:hypothetical protein